MNAPASTRDSHHSLDNKKQNKKGNIIQLVVYGPPDYKRPMKTAQKHKNTKQNEIKAPEQEILSCQRLPSLNLIRNTASSPRTRTTCTTAYSLAFYYHFVF